MALAFFNANALISKSFVAIFLIFFSRICIALPLCIHIRLFFLFVFQKYKKKKMERGMWKDVFCITYHGCVVKVDHIIFA